MRKLLSTINLGDAYEIQARVFPAMLAVLPVTTLILMFEGQNGRWLTAIGLGGGLEVVLAVAFSKIGHALGRDLEERLLCEWGGMPTTRWLLPGDKTHSDQQKTIWRKAIARLAGLDLDAVFAAGDSEEIRRIVEDAVLNARNKIRAVKQATMLRHANIMFGFARNVAGLRWIIVILSVGSLAGAFAGCSRHVLTIGAILIEGLFTAISFGFLRVAISYVRHCANRYAEFFYVACVNVANVKTRSSAK